MFGKRIELFRLFGIPLRIDLSWFIVAILVTWSLAENYFPSVAVGLSSTAYWVMGAFGAVGLFASVVLHELAHALVARTFGLSIGGITLFIFGGVAEMESEPPSAKAEFMVAIAGPIASLLIASGCFFLVGIPWSFPGATVVVGILTYLAFINRMLAIFNMVPAFPLDGGRVLGSALGQWKKSLPWATSVTSRIGSGFGVALVILGGLEIVLRQNLVGGIWFILIGMFLRNAARMSYRHLLVRNSLEGETVRRFMRTDPMTVPRSMSVAELVDRYFNRYRLQFLPVVDGSHLMGCVSASQIQELSPEEWELHTVGAIAVPCSPQSTIAPDSDAMGAMARMSRAESSHLMVVEEGRLVGVIALQDLLEFLASKGKFRAAPAA